MHNSLHTVIFEPIGKRVTVPAGTSLVEDAQLAGLEINQPCGGQGRCGRCLVKVESGQVRRRSIARLTAEDRAWAGKPAAADMHKFLMNGG